MDWNWCGLLLLLAPVLAWCEQVEEDIHSSSDLSQNVKFHVDIGKSSEHVAASSEVFNGYIKLRVNPRYIEQSGNWVTVRWSGVSNPSDADWIGVYSPPVDDTYPIDAAYHAPIKYQYANVSSSHITYGRGYMLMRMVNMRSPIVMGFFRGDMNNVTLLAFSNNVYFQNYNEPLQVHLSLTNKPTEVIVTWVSGDVLLPVVYWGPLTGYYTHVRIAQTNTYTYRDMCSSPAIDFGYRDPGLIHKATLSNLQPGQEYFYVIGDNYGWSQEYSFRAPPLFNQTFAMVAFGDSGCTQQDGTHMVNQHPPSLNVTESIFNEIDELDLIMHLGGLSYAKGYSSVWDSFFDQIQPLASTIPYMVAAGEAESGQNTTNTTAYNDTDSGGECGVPFMKRFQMPWSEEAGETNPWYTFSFGSAYFVVISTEHDFTEGSLQYEFIISALMSVDRTTVSWLIMAGHRPMYTASSQDYNEQTVTDALQAHLEPLFKTYDVDLALWAHHRSYQRTCLVYRGYCMFDKGQGTVHLVIGTGGTHLESDRISDEVPNWIQYINAQNHGYARLTVAPDILTIDYISSERGVTLDTLVLQKNDSDDQNYDQQEMHQRL